MLQLSGHLTSSNDVTVREPVASMEYFKVEQDLIPDGLTLHQILSFVRLALALKNDIILVQPPSVLPSLAPTSLPSAICNFLWDIFGGHSALLEVTERRSLDIPDL